MNDFELKAIASEIARQRPDLYEAVTGEPVWADQVGPQYAAATKKWHAWVEARMAENEILEDAS